MATPRFRKPEEMRQEKDDKVPVSSRIKASTRDLLERQAKANGLSLALLLGTVIEDYAAWLREQEPRRKS